MGPEDLPHRVAEPGPSASRATSKVAGILVEHGGENCLRHVIADYEIAKCRTRIPAKCPNPLPERSICVRQLALCPEKTRQHQRAAIDGILGHYLELLAA